MNRGGVALVTGFPDCLLARKVAQTLLRDQGVQLRLIQSEPDSETSEPLVEETFSGFSNWKERVTLLEGCTTHVDFGLSGAEYNALAEEVSHIHHCASTTSPTMGIRRARHVNMGGAREVVELAEAAANLARLIHWSSTRVTGRAEGVVLESDLSDAAGFFAEVDATLFRAERLICDAGRQLPITVLRPSTLVGDSRSGEIDRFDGAYFLMQLLENGPAEGSVPFPGTGEFPLNLVPVDHAVHVGLAICADDRSLGRTFHIVDDQPPTALEVFSHLAAAMGRSAPHASGSGWSNTLLKLPGVGRFASLPKAFVDQLATDVRFDSSNTQEILAQNPIPCPPFPSYVDRLVEYWRTRNASG